jgi:5-methylcytosine-specific restriction endonuclease McrA
MKFIFTIVREVDGIRFSNKRQRGSKHTAYMRKMLLKRDGDLCFFCGKPLKEDITIEHLLSMSKGGSNSIENLVLAHSLCNELASCLSCAEKMKLAVKLQLCDK